MILLTVLSLNIVGDGLRDALDPRSKVRLEAHAGHGRARGDGGLMARFVARRLVGMVAGPVRGLGARLPDLQRDPQLRPGAAAGRQERDPDPGQEHRRGMGLRRIAAGPVRDDDEEGLHRRTDLLRRPSSTSTNRSSKGSRRRFSLSIGAARDLALLRRPASATSRRSGPAAGSTGLLTVRRGGRDLDPGLPARPDPPLLPHLQDRTVPQRRLRAADRRPGRSGPTT